MHSTNVLPAFASLIHPGVILSPKLKEMIYTYDKTCHEQTELDNAITKLREKQIRYEDKLADALAEEEFQRCQSGQLTSTSESELLKIFKKCFGVLFEELAAKQERKIYLEMGLLKLKVSIEKGIATANQESAAASND